MSKGTQHKQFHHYYQDYASSDYAVVSSLANLIISNLRLHVCPLTDTPSQIASTVPLYGRKSRTKMIGGSKSFHKKAGISQDDFVFTCRDSLLSSRAASDAILPSALLVERLSLGTSWAYSFQQQLLPIVSNATRRCGCAFS